MNTNKMSTTTNAKATTNAKVNDFTKELNLIEKLELSANFDSFSVANGISYEQNKGIIFERIGENRTKVMLFKGSAFIADSIEESDKTLFEVWKNLISAMWSTYNVKENIRSEYGKEFDVKMWFNIPDVITISAKNDSILRIELTETIWSKIGLKPTKEVLSMNSKDFKNAIHKSAKMSFAIIMNEAHHLIKK